MKRLFLTLLFTAGISAGFSQTINFGIKAGLNLSELTHINQADYGSKMLPGFNAGGIVDIGFTNFSIQPGIFYSTKGEKDTKQFTDLNQHYYPSTFELDYVEIPVNILYKAKLSPAITLDLGGGPYIAYGVSETLKVSYPASIITNDYSSYHHYGYRNPDFGINLIAGFTIKNKWLIDAGYSIGLQNLQTPDTMHNRAISLSLGYLFK